jgi:hypothetical protein
MRGSGRRPIAGASVTTERALALLEELIAAYDALREREVVRVLRAAWAHIDEHGRRSPGYPLKAANPGARIAPRAWRQRE